MLSRAKKWFFAAVSMFQLFSDRAFALIINVVKLANSRIISTPNHVNIQIRLRQNTIHLHQKNLLFILRQQQIRAQIQHMPELAQTTLTRVARRSGTKFGRSAAIPFKAPVISYCNSPEFPAKN